MSLQEAASLLRGATNPRRRMGRIPIHLSRTMNTASHAAAASSSQGSAMSRQEVIREVLAMLKEHGMDVVFVGHYTEGSRRFRVVEALHHGPAAALATSRATESSGRTVEGTAGRLLEAPVVMRDGSVHGMLCCTSADEASAERDLRWLRHGARLAARLLDQEQVLRELSAQSLNH